MWAEIEYYVVHDALSKWPINQFKIKTLNKLTVLMYIYIVNRYTTVKPLWYNLGLLETTTLKGFTTKIALPPFLVRKFHFYIWYFKEHGRNTLIKYSFN